MVAMNSSSHVAKYDLVKSTIIVFVQGHESVVMRVVLPRRKPVHIDQPFSRNVSPSSSGWRLDATLKRSRPCGHTLSHV